MEGEYPVYTLISSHFLFRLLDEVDRQGTPRVIEVRGHRAVLGWGTGREYDVPLPPETGRGCWHVACYQEGIRLEMEEGAGTSSLGGSPVRGDVDLFSGDVITFGPLHSPYRVLFELASAVEAPVRRRIQPPPRIESTAGTSPSPSPIKLHRSPGGWMRDLLRSRAARRDLGRRLRPSSLLTAGMRRVFPSLRRILPLFLSGCALLGTLWQHQRHQTQVVSLKAERDQAIQERDRWQAAAVEPSSAEISPFHSQLLHWIQGPELANDPYYQPEAGMLQAVSEAYRHAQDSSWFRWLVTRGRGGDLVRLAGPDFAGLPELFLYHPLVESAACPFALSTTGARGVWQFTYGTAMTLGLRVDVTRRDPDWVKQERVRIAQGGSAPDYAACDPAVYSGSAVDASPWFAHPADPADERTDVPKASRAAAAYHRQIWERTELVSLPDQAERLWFTLAGWNCGPENIKDGLAQLSARGYRRTFWNLWSHDSQGDIRVRCDAEENLRHVPKVVGWYLAAKISRGEWKEGGR